jgi:hypothetical protein
MTGQLRFDPRQRQEDLSSKLCGQNGSGTHTRLLSNGYRGSFPWGKAWPGRDADHSPPSSAKVVNEKELYLLSLLHTSVSTTSKVHTSTRYDCRKLDKKLELSPMAYCSFQNIWSSVSERGKETQDRKSRLTTL